MHQYNILAIRQTLYDQFDNNNIIKLEIANKQDDDDNNNITKHETDPSNITILQ